MTTYAVEVLPPAEGPALVLPDRLWSKVDRNGPVPEHRPDLGPCWVWTGAKTNAGYGQLGRRMGGKQFSMMAHRLAYEAVVGPIPDGLQIDHLCRVPSCVRPDHLEPVTLKENLMRGVGPSAINAKKTTCKRGHPLSGDNLFTWRDRRGCLICRKSSSDAHHARQKAARAAR